MSLLLWTHSADCTGRGVLTLLTLVQENVIEKEINMGQLEELIEQAEDELSVIPVYLGTSVRIPCSISESDESSNLCVCVLCLLNRKQALGTSCERVNTACAA